MWTSIPRKAAVECGALTEAACSPLNSVQKFYFVFTSSGLFKSGYVKTLLVQSSLVVSVRADLKRKRPKSFLKLNSFSDNSLPFIVTGH